ncbi:MAG: hypothetical protein BLITH_1599 [Brockia lithotrophica]|uniref:Uncharacterized protein n=1 Tax=Brockia lithotrophica TaxID=933949 RepID=A0A2T5G5Q6_9BACL|nr:MAG: hypothetical protein BLITH_1599 [Brockia lithotrophica]
MAQERKIAGGASRWVWILGTAVLVALVGAAFALAEGVPRDVASALAALKGGDWLYSLRVRLGAVGTPSRLALPSGDGGEAHEVDHPLYHPYSYAYRYVREVPGDGVIWLEYEEVLVVEDGRGNPLREIPTGNTMRLRVTSPRPSGFGSRP